MCVRAHVSVHTQARAHTHTRFSGGQQVANKCSTGARAVVSASESVSFVTVTSTPGQSGFVPTASAAGGYRQGRLVTHLGVGSAQGLAQCFHRQNKQKRCTEPLSSSSNPSWHHRRTGSKATVTRSAATVLRFRRCRSRTVTRSHTRTTRFAGPHPAPGTPACSLSCAHD